MTREPPRAAILWLLLAVIALIAYGSLYPFNIRADAFEGGVLRALSLLSWQRAGRADRISNVLLYLPLGFLLYLLFAPRVNRAASLVLATLLGALLSLAIELTQIYISVRVPSLTDLSLNTAGALLGALGGVGWRGLSSLMSSPVHAEKTPRDPSAALVISLWLLWRFAPFAPQFDLAKLKSALEPLIRPTIEPAAVFIYLSCWLVVHQAVAAIAARQHRLEGLLIVIAAVLVGRLLLANQAFVPSELVALMLLLPLLVLIHRMKARPRRAALVLAMLAVLIIEGLGPFDFVSGALRFDMWPFKSWWANGAAEGWLHLDWVQLFGALFLYAALVWVLREWSGSANLAAGVTIALALSIELLQMWLPQEQASITEPLLAAAIAWVMHALDRRRRPRGLAGASIARAARSR